MFLSSFEHEYVEEESATEPRDSTSKLLLGQSPNSEPGNTVWNAKVCCSPLNCSLCFSLFYILCYTKLS